MTASALPVGTVTFVFTDIEGSTRLLEEVGDGRYSELLAEHHRVCRASWAAHGGVEVDTAGDAFFVAFVGASDALAAAAAAQEALAATPFRVRMGIHTGEVLLGETGYVGLEVHRAARIAAAAHGGQVVVSQSTASLVGVEGLVDLGDHRFKDLAAAERVYQLGEGEFSPLKSLYRVTLPVPATAFLGRVAELDAVVGLLTEAEHWLVTLSGPGGTGKTRLALQAGAEVSDRFPDGVFWVGLAALRDPLLVVSQLAQAAGVEAQPGRLLPEVIGERLGGRRLLVLLDNAEHLLPGLAAELAALRATVPTLRLLVTSRERIQLTGERVYQVPSLEEPEAVQLFCERAAGVGALLEPSQVVRELCLRLDHLPLALELAAARTVLFTPQQLLERLSQRLDLLKGARDADPRQQTLRATIEWSYQLLVPDEQRVYRALSVFAGGCTFEAAENVADTDLDTLQSLLDKSLLRRRDTEHGPRLWMLETIREFAVEHLEASGEEGPLRDGHGKWFLELVRGVGSGPRRLAPEAIAAIAPEHGNIREAIAWSIETGEADIAHELVGRLCVYWIFTGSAAEGVRLGEALLASSGQGGSAAARFASLTGLSELLRATGDFARSVVLKQQALELLDQLDDGQIMHGGATDAFPKEKVAAMLTKDLAQVHAELGEFDTARALADDAIARTRALGDENFVAYALYAKGIVDFSCGRFAEARELFQATLATWIRIGSRPDVAGTRLMLGQCLRREDRCEEAIGELQSALELSVETGDVSALPEVMQELAAVTVTVGSPEAGACLIGSSERLRNEMGMGLWDPLDYERTVTALRDRLGEDAFEERRRHGAALTEEEAVALARSID